MAIDKIIETLKIDCKYYLELLSQCKYGHFLLRAYNYPINDIEKFTHNYENRKPRNTPQNMHDKLNKKFEEQFGWKIRNGVFCYGFDILNNVPTDLGYGPFYVCFPIGEFDYAYSYDHFDLFGSMSTTKINMDEFIDSLKYTNESFCDVMVTHPEFHNFGNEVSLYVNSYYLVNLDLADELVPIIWPV